MPASTEHAPPPPITHYGPGWLVVDKPSGMSVHNAPGEDLCSLINRQMQDDQTWGRRVRFDAQYGIHPVHRLDKETSGIILLACRRDVFYHFSRQFDQGEVIKKYLALVHGNVRKSADGTHWQWPLTPNATGRRHPQGQGRRKPCHTQCRVLAHSRHYTLLRCRLLTGRTHQIRRHAALAGHPLLGDRRYGSMRACRYLEKHHGFNRLALHSAGLMVQPPDYSEPQHFASEQPPKAIQQVLDADQ